MERDTFEKMEIIIGNLEEMYKVFNEYDFNTKDISNDLRISEEDVREYMGMILSNTPFK